MIRANIDARDCLTDNLIFGELGRERVPQLTAAEAAEALNGWVYKQPGMPTIVDCQNACDKITKRFGESAVTTLFQREGVSRLKDMWIGSYVGFVNFANACLEYDVGPECGWARDGDTFKPNQGSNYDDL